MHITGEGKVGITLGLLGLAGTGAALMLPEQRWIGALIIYLALVALGILTLHHFEVGRRKMIPAIGMVTFGIAFFGCAVWYYSSPKSSGEPPVEKFSSDDTSPQEQMRRKFILDDARQAFLNSHPKADPSVFAGLKDPPNEYVNNYLREKGESWSYKPEKIKPSTEASFYVDCSYVVLPAKFSREETVQTISVIPVPLEAGGGAGWASSSLPSTGEFDFGIGKKSPTIQKCIVTNYGNKPIIDIVLGLYVVWQEVVTDPKEPNVQRGGAIHLERPWRLDIPKIEPGIAGNVTFYVPNYLNYFVQITFPSEASGRFIDEKSRSTFPLSSNLYIPLLVDPFSGG